MLELCRSVVHNPVRAGLVKSARAWSWSRYRVTVGESREPSWVTTDWLLAQCGQRRAAAICEYQQFVAAGVGQQPWKDLIGQLYYGDEQFVTRMAKSPLQPEVPRRQRQPIRAALERLVTADTPEAIGQAYRDYGYRLGEIAQHLGVHYAPVSRRLKQFEQRRGRTRW